jgi:hypothetical protein
MVERKKKYFSSALVANIIWKFKRISKALVYKILCSIYLFVLWRSISPQGWISIEYYPTKLLGANYDLQLLCIQ